jgi:hypothetical protein
MVNQKDRKIFEFRGKEKNLSKSTFSWLAQYDEEDDFLCGNVSIALSELTEEE